MNERADTAVAGVRLQRICKRFGGRAVLDQVSLDIGRGEFFALVGPSGSGKSTLLKMVSGIDVPDSGQVWLGSKDVTRVPPYRRPVHTVFQSYALFPHLDVADNVGFPLRVAGMPRPDRSARVQRALAWVKLEQFAGRKIDALSGGERQRVALARALVDNPECVLLDEPLSALDPHLRGQTLELLQEIQARLHVTYLYVTHDREEALRASHRMGVLNHGILEQVGLPEEVYHRPATPFVASFVGPINWFKGERAEVNGRPVVRLPSGHDLPLGGQPVPASTSVLLGIRPEAIGFVATGWLSARVVQRQFSGALVSMRMEADGGTFLAAEVPAHTRPPAVGESVQVTWSPEAGHLFPADG